MTLVLIERGAPGCTCGTPPYAPPEPASDCPFHSGGLRYRCDSCGVLSSNEDHICVQYDDNKPCPTCAAPSVYCLAGAPGTGGSWVCKNNHHWGSTVRELQEWEVI